MFQSNLGGKEEFKGIKRIQATNHVNFTMSGINQKLLSTDAGRDWGQEEKGTTEDETAGWHH